MSFVFKNVIDKLVYSTVQYCHCYCYCTQNSSLLLILEKKKWKYCTHTKVNPFRHRDSAGQYENLKLEQKVTVEEKMYDS